MSNNDIAVAAKIAQEQFGKSAVVHKSMARCFYAVGGTWRNLAKLHMATKHYRLPVMHGYEVDAVEMEDFLRFVVNGSIENMKGISAVSKIAVNFCLTERSFLSSLFGVWALKNNLFGGWSP